MYLFFLRLRVGWQHITWPLPDIAQFMQLAADGVPREPTAIPGSQLLLQQRHGPIHRLEAPLRGPFLQQRLQEFVQIWSPAGRTTTALGVTQRQRIKILSIQLDPVVDRLSCYPQRTSN